MEESIAKLVDELVDSQPGTILGCWGFPEGGLLEDIEALCASKGVDDIVLVNWLRLTRTLFKYKGNGQKNSPKCMLSCSMTILAALFGRKQEHTGCSDCRTQHHVMTSFLFGMYKHYKLLGVDFKTLQ